MLCTQEMLQGKRSDKQELIKTKERKVNELLIVLLVLKMHFLPCLKVISAKLFDAGEASDEPAPKKKATRGFQQAWKAFFEWLVVLCIDRVDHLSCTMCLRAMKIDSTQFSRGLGPKPSKNMKKETLSDHENSKEHIVVSHCLSTNALESLQFSPVFEPMHMDVSQASKSGS